MEKLSYGLQRNTVLLTLRQQDSEKAESLTEEETGAILSFGFFNSHVMGLLVC